MSGAPHWKHNPWGLSERECDALRAIVQHGSGKAAAKALNRSLHTIEVHCERSRDKMAKHDAIVWGSRSRYLILFDRWERGHLEPKT